jgi:hypothetical protein
MPENLVADSGVDFHDEFIGSEKYEIHIANSLLMI